MLIRKHNNPKISAKITASKYMKWKQVELTASKQKISRGAEDFDSLINQLDLMDIKEHFT